MAAAIKKVNARKWLAHKEIVALPMARAGVGGMEGKPIISFQVDDYIVYMTKADLEGLAAFYA